MLINYTANDVLIASLTITKGVPATSYSGAAAAMAVRNSNVGSSVKLGANVIWVEGDPEVTTKQKQAGVQETVANPAWVVTPADAATITPDGKVTFLKPGKHLVGLNWSFKGADGQMKTWTLAADYIVGTATSLKQFLIPLAIGAVGALLGIVGIRKRAKQG